MSNTAFFSHIGLFVIEDFLSEEQCDQIRGEANASRLVSAKIVDSTDTVNIQDSYRKTKTAQISKSRLLNIYEQILLLKPAIEDHFNIELEGCEVPQVLVYHTGDYFKVHRDNVAGQDTVVTRTAKRQISIVIFLNDQTAEPAEGSYCGGSLNLYDILDNPSWKDKGFPIKGRSGLLFAFRSGIEVV